MTADLTRFLAAHDAVLNQWPVPVDRMDLTSVYGTTRVTACGPVDGSRWCSCTVAASPRQCGTRTWPT